MASRFLSRRRTRVAPQARSAARATGDAPRPARASHARLGCAAEDRQRGEAHLELVPDPRVESAIDEVDDEVHDGQEHAVREDDGHDHRVVAARHRLHEEAPHAGHAEDRLDEERAGADGGEHRAQQRHDRNERVLERVLEDHRPARPVPWRAR